MRRTCVHFAGIHSISNVHRYQDLFVMAVSVASFSCGYICRSRKCPYYVFLPMRRTNFPKTLVSDNLTTDLNFHAEKKTGNVFRFSFFLLTRAHMFQSASLTYTLSLNHCADFVSLSGTSYVNHIRIMCMHTVRFLFMREKNR